MEEEEGKREGRGQVAGVVFFSLLSLSPYVVSIPHFHHPLGFALPFLRFFNGKATHRLVARTAAFLNAVSNSRPNRFRPPCGQIRTTRTSSHRLASAFCATVKFVEAFPPATAAPRCRSLSISFFSPPSVCLTATTFKHTHTTLIFSPTPPSMCK